MVRDLLRADPDDLYLAFHAERYAFVLQTVGRYVAGPDARVLDIGSSKLTRLIHDAFGATVDSLGFGSDHDSPTGRHFALDLNHTEDRARWRAGLPRYDVVIMAEVIEHLHVSPVHVLGFLRTLLRPAGVLFVQTPNAAAFHKRIKLLLGRNPYELIREDPRNPGHFREYTAAELRRYAKATGLSVEHCSYENYFDYRFVRHGPYAAQPRWYLGLANVGYALVPPPLKPGLSLVLRLQ